MFAENGFKRGALIRGAGNANTPVRYIYRGPKYVHKPLKPAIEGGVPQCQQYSTEASRIRFSFVLQEFFKASFVLHVARLSSVFYGGACIALRCVTTDGGCLVMKPARFEQVTEKLNEILWERVP